MRRQLPELAVDHLGDGDGGAALREALSQLNTQVIYIDRLVGERCENGASFVAIGAAAMVVYEHLAASAGVDTRRYRTASVSWWPPGD
jgi:hypothetical protein